MPPPPHTIQIGTERKSDYHLHIIGKFDKNRRMHDFSYQTAKAMDNLLKTYLFANVFRQQETFSKLCDCLPQFTLRIPQIHVLSI
jgi:hypothetical protein